MERTKIFHFQRRQISAKAIPLSLDIIDKGNVALVLVTTRRKSCIDVGGLEKFIQPTSRFVSRDRDSGGWGIPMGQ